MRFSVIAPVYNVERYLDTFVKSVLAQTFSDFELILVDDKSPDNCPSLCDAFAQSDHRVRVLHKPENEGLGFARNSGLEAASGDYVLFADSDDYLEPDLLEQCNTFLEDGNDILVFGVTFCYENKDGKVVRKDCLVPEVFKAQTKKENADMFAMLNKKRIFQYAWNKIYRRDFLLSLDKGFEKTKLIEDFLFNVYAFEKANGILTVDKAFYNYRKPQHETLASKYTPEVFEIFKRKYTLEKQFLINCDGLEAHKNLIDEIFVKHFISVVLKNRRKSSGLTKREQRVFIRNMCDDELTKQIVAEYQPSDTKYKIICNSIKSKRVLSISVMCLLIDFVQQHMAPIFKKILNR